ncbi:MAG: hypothetical protein PHQ13_00290 [Rhodoferax sp.]|nr:hypothetical protein [Rhodoferax sp.]
MLHQRAGRIKLISAANPTFADIALKGGQILETSGVVTYSIKQFQV